MREETEEVLECVLFTPMLPYLGTRQVLKSDLRTDTNHHTPSLHHLLYPYLDDQPDTSFVQKFYFLSTPLLILFTYEFNAQGPVRTQLLV